MKNGKKTKSKSDFYQSLFLLKVLYGKFVDILEAFCTGPLIITNGELNSYYVSIRKLIDQLFEKEEFKELGKEEIEFPESLVGDIEEVDLDWEYGGRQAARKTLGKIENLFVSSGCNTFTLEETLKNILKEIEGAIEEHKKRKDEQWKKISGKIEENIKKIKKMSGIKLKKQQTKKLITFVEGKLQIDDYKIINFKPGLRRELIDFFYNSDKQKEWKNYDEIRKYVGKEYTSEGIRKEIERINKRIAKHTNHRIKMIIDIRKEDFANLYRWRL